MEPMAGLFVGKERAMRASSLANRRVPAHGGPRTAKPIRAGIGGYRLGREACWNNRGRTAPIPPAGEPISHPLPPALLIRFSTRPGATVRPTPSVVALPPGFWIGPRHIMGGPSVPYSNSPQKLKRPTRRSPSSTNSLYLDFDISAQTPIFAKMPVEYTL